MITRYLLLSFLLALPPFAGQNDTFLGDYARTQGALVHGSEATFARFVQPYAPLDLQVTNQSVANAQRARDRFLGAAAKASGLTPDAALAIDTAFHCDDCPEKRQQQFKTDLPAIRTLVDEFAKQPATLHLIARWGPLGDFRVNDVFHQGMHTQAYQEVDGFFPGAPRKVFATLPAALAGSGLSLLELRKLLAAMAANHIIALVRTSDGIRALRTGISHSEAGLLFVTNPDFKAEPRDEDNGIRITGFTPLAKDVFYFES
jgi:hypothetical protein